MFGQRVKVTIVFTVDQELFPGLFYDPEDFARSTCKDIKRILSSYKPEIEETIVRVFNEKGSARMERNETSRTQPLSKKSCQQPPTDDFVILFNEKFTKT